MRAGVEQNVASQGIGMLIMESVLQQSVASTPFDLLRTGVTFIVIIAGSFGNSTVLDTAMLGAECEKPCIQLIVKLRTLKSDTRNREFSRVVGCLNIIFRSWVSGFVFGKLSIVLLDLFEILPVKPNTISSNQRVQRTSCPRPSHSETFNDSTRLTLYTPRYLKFRSLFCPHLGIPTNKLHNFGIVYVSLSRPRPTNI